MNTLRGRSARAMGVTFGLCMAGAAWCALRSAAVTPATPSSHVAELSPAQFTAYTQAIARTAGMVSDASAQRLAQGHQLQVLNLTWEDTGRYYGSSVGPNISDMTIQVFARNPRNEQLGVTCMPVIRFPNFSDRTADLSPRDFTLLVGNQAGRALRRVSLRDFLNTPTAFMSRPWEWKGPRHSLLAARDSKVLVSAQACFLPVPRGSQAVFNPVVFNYQSVQGNPAVLTILATREGTSTTIIDNTRDAFETGAVWGQRLFHNANGQRASLTGTRQSDFQRTNPGASGPSPSVGNTHPQSGLNMVLLIQVPLKQRPMPRSSFGAASGALEEAPDAITSDGHMSRRSNVENAVIGHGALEGRFTETDNVSIERDPRYPVRVTVQFYKATDNGVVSPADLQQISEQINRVYSQSQYVGSLVTGGNTGRVTEYEGIHVQPADWWEQFWQRREHETGKSREQILAELHNLLGYNFTQQPVSDLYLRDKLRG